MVEVSETVSMCKQVLFCTDLVYVFPIMLSIMYIVFFFTNATGHGIRHLKNSVSKKTTTKKIEVFEIISICKHVQS